MLLKYDVLDGLIHNFTKLVEQVSESPLDSDIAMNSPFGYCSTKTIGDKADGKIVVSTETKREQCTGPIKNELVKELEKYDEDVTDIKGSSELKFGYYYDETTKKFSKFYLTMSGQTTSRPVKAEFHSTTEVELGKFKRIQNDFGEMQYSEIYKDEDIQALKPIA